MKHILNRAESSGGITRLQHYNHHGCNFAVSRDEIMTGTPNTPRPTSGVNPRQGEKFHIRPGEYSKYMLAIARAATL